MSEIKAVLERLTHPGGEYAIQVEEMDGFPTRAFVNRPRHISEFVTRALRDGVPGPPAGDSAL